jgi:hypothetical protein
MTYALNPHTFVCIDRQRTVILDLKQDRYLQISLENSNRLAGYIQGWPAVSQHSTPPDSAPGGSSDVMSFAASIGKGGHTGDVGQGLADLLHLGLINAQPEPPVPAARVVLPAPQWELLPRGDAPPPRTWRTFLRCYIAGRLAGRWLRTLPLHEVVRRVRVLPDRDVNSTLDRALAQHVVGTFLYLRPYLRSSKDACLLESLSLLHVLSLYHIHVHWVFGVRTEPFFAHCWLQKHDCVLDDSLDRVRQFTAIMVV